MGLSRVYQHQSHKLGKSDNDLYKIFKYGVYYVACVQPPLPSKKLERIFLRGGAAVHRLGVYQTNTSHLKMWQFT